MEEDWEVGPSDFGVGLGTGRDEKRKRGRPRKENPGIKQVNLRLTRDEQEMLDFICYKTGKSRTDILKEGLKMEYNLTKYQ